MKKTIIDRALAVLAAIALLGSVLGIGRCKYSVWRGKYPSAQTWHFFIPERR